MISKKLTASLAFALLASTTFAAGPAADIDDLAWMTGNWVGNLGPNTLEENWILPTGGSIASMVRMTGNGGTSMFEVITIEEKDGSPLAVLTPSELAGAFAEHGGGWDHYLARLAIAATGGDPGHDPIADSDSPSHD